MFHDIGDVGVEWVTGYSRIAKKNISKSKSLISSKTDIKHKPNIEV